MGTVSRQESVPNRTPAQCDIGHLPDFQRAHAAMVAKVPCNLTPRHPPSQVVDNLPRYGG
jgi:hypothetical protein